MNEQGICILFSILLVPVNFLCAFWLFREALQLTGMTYQEYFKKTSSDGEVLLGSEQRWGYTNRFFKAYSSDPEKSMHFMKIYAAALLPGLAAVLLLCYAEAHAERLSGVLSGDFALLAVNAALALAGVLYRRRHPMDPVAAERLREKRRKERAYNRKHWKKIAVKGTVCAAVSAADSVYFCRRHIEIAAAAARADGDAAQRDSVRHSAGAGLRNRERFAHLPVGGG